MVRNIKSFTDLLAWLKGHALVKIVYDFFEKMHRYNALKNQIERSAFSVTSSIAEGFGRETVADKKHFYVVARGSAYELQSQIILSRGIGYISHDEYSKLMSSSTDSIKLIHGLIRSLRVD